jgi:hypothetical protein
MVELVGVTPGKTGAEQEMVAVDAQPEDSALPEVCAVTVNTPPG